MYNLKFFKGASNELPLVDKESNSFYLTEDTHDLYYAKTKTNLTPIFTNPKNRVKSITTYYSVTANTVPQNFPPSSEWSTTKPFNYGNGKQGYQVNCVEYMDGHYEYLKIKELITIEDIDFICFGNYTTSTLGIGKLNQMILNLEEEE